MKTKMNIHRDRRGISMVEVVIALVIISIISASALTMVMLSVNVEADALAAVEVAISAENTIECFRYAENKGDFLAALQKTAEFTEQEDGSFLYDAGGYTVTVIPSETNFAYSAVYENGEEIYSFIYPYQGEEGGTAE